MPIAGFRAPVFARAAFGERSSTGLYDGAADLACTTPGPLNCEGLAVAAIAGLP